MLPVQSVYSAQHCVDIFLLAREFYIRVGHALLCHACGGFNILAGQRRNYELTYSLYECTAIRGAIFIFIVDHGSLENSFNVADGMGGHLEFFPSACRQCIPRKSRVG
jgi:hypothetical protein